MTVGGSISLVATGLVLAFAAYAASRSSPPVETCSTAAPVALRINKDGSVDFQGERLRNNTEVVARFAKLAQHAPQPNIRLLPDKHASYDGVANVLRAAQETGVSCFGFVGIER